MQHLERTNTSHAAPRAAPGAALAWTRYEAEDARSNVRAEAASRAYLTMTAEAAGRRFVKLTRPGDHLAFRVTEAANSLVLRYAIPDAADGAGLYASLSLYINDRPFGKLPLTSRYAWAYGAFPWTLNPADGSPHHFFDEHRMLLPALSPGDQVRLQIDDGDEADYYAIDFIELEQVPPPLSRPPESLCLSDFTDAWPPDGPVDKALSALLEAAEAEGRIAWIPAGVFDLNGSPKRLGRVRVQGAGLWHTTIRGNGAMFRGGGARFDVRDLAIHGEVRRRIDTTHENAFTGDLGDGSRIHSVWIERMKCGIWSTHGTRNLRVSNCRIRNTHADGINLCDGTRDATVEQCHIRNTGDDGLATWSPSAAWSSGVPCERNRFVHNTVELPRLANGIALYGGLDHEVRGNLVVDTVVSGGGLLISSGHGALPFGGVLRVSNNRFVRTGGDCYVDGWNGGLWVHAHESDIDAAIWIEDLVVEDPAHAGLTVHGPGAARNLVMKQVRIEGAVERTLHVMPGAGEISLTLDGITLRPSPHAHADTGPR